MGEQQQQQQTAGGPQDGQQIMLRGDNGYFFARDIGRGSLDAKYERVPPVRFSADSDDLFMSSMIMKYAAEEKDEDSGVPTGKFFMNEASARAAATEVVGSHKGLAGAELKGYISTYFPRTWAHFDVNGSGMIGVEVMPQFVRFIASDQTLQL